MFSVDDYFQQDAAAWLGRLTRRGSDGLDVAGFCGDLVRHIHPDSFLDARKAARGEVPVVGFADVRGVVENEEAVIRAVSAYAKVAPVGVRLCRFDEVRDFVPDGLVVELSEGALRWSDWQDFVLRMNDDVAGYVRDARGRLTVADFDVSAWLVACLNECSVNVDPRNGNCWRIISGNVDVWRLLEDFARDDRARGELTRLNDRYGDGDVAGAGDLHDRIHAASGLLDLSGANFGTTSTF